MLNIWKMHRTSARFSLTALAPSLATLLFLSGPGALGQGISSAPSEASYPAPTEYDRSLVSVFQRSEETPPVYHAVVHAVAALPPGVKDTLVKAGVRWKVVPTLVDYDQRLADMQARGWKEGNDFRYVAGTYSFRHNEVLIAVRALRPKDGVMAARGHRLQTTLHETGHGYDHVIGKYSKTADFRSAYNDDVSRLSSDQRSELKYYLQADDAGPNETFAELFAEGVMRQAKIQPETGEIVQFFPRTFEVVARLLR